MSQNELISEYMNYLNQNAGKGQPLTISQFAEKLMPERTTPVQTFLANEYEKNNPLGIAQTHSSNLPM